MSKLERPIALGNISPNQSVTLKICGEEIPTTIDRISRFSPFFKKQIERHGISSVRASSMTNLDFRSPWMVTEMLECYAHANHEMQIEELLNAEEGQPIHDKIARFALIAHKFENYALEQKLLEKLEAQLDSIESIARLVELTYGFELDSATQTVVKCLSRKVDLSRTKDVEEIEKLSFHNFGPFLHEYSKVRGTEGQIGWPRKWENIKAHWLAFLGTPKITAVPVLTPKFGEFQHRIVIPPNSSFTFYNTLQFILLDAVNYQVLIELKEVEDTEHRQILCDHSVFVCERMQKIYFAQQEASNTAAILIRALRQFSICQIEFKCETEGPLTFSAPDLNALIVQPSAYTNVITPFNTKVLFDGVEFPEFFAWENIPFPSTSSCVPGSCWYDSPVVTDACDMKEIRIIFFQPYALQELNVIISRANAEFAVGVVKLEKSTFGENEARLRRLDSANIKKHGQKVVVHLSDRLVIKELVIRGEILRYVPPSYKKNVTEFNFESTFQNTAVRTTY